MHFNLHTPKTIREALKMKQETSGAWLAGGTVLLVNNHQGKPISEDMISLEKLDELKNIRENETDIVIGSLVTFDDIEKSEIVNKNAFALWEAACSVGGPQIRHRATIGGNIAVASPASDGVTPLMALDASVKLTSAEGERYVKLTDFYVGKFQTAMKKDELLTAVIIPKASRISRFIKVGKRQALAVSSINSAIAKTGEGIRFCVGSSAPEVRYCKKSSAALSEGKLDEACRELQTEISPIDDRWGTADYRRQVAENLMKKLYRELEEKDA